MRLVSCHIENFGKLKDYDKEFTEGCNSIMANNGQGKSTLASFIRVMFYGFEGEGRRKTGVSERRKFTPWQGGVFGGRLTFNDGHDTYVIIRTFGSKPADDTFELRAVSTNLISDAYTDNIGEELFGVNSESYMRTAFIGQNDVVTHTTDGINAMIGGIADNTGDLDSFEKAAAKLNDLLNKESPTRSTGSLYRLEEEVTALRTRVREGSIVLDTIHRLEDSMGARQGELEELNRRRKELTDRQAGLSIYKDKQSLKDKWESVRAEYKEAQSEEASKRAVFPGEVPDEAELADMQKAAAEYGRLCENVGFHILSANDTEALASMTRRFAAGMPDMNDTTALIRKKREADESLARDAEDKAELKVLKGEYDAVRRESKRMPAGAFVGMGLIIVAVLAAFIALFLGSAAALKWAALGTCLLICAAGVFTSVFGIRRHKRDIEAELDDIEREMDELRRYIAQGADHRQDVMDEIGAYLGRYGMSTEPSSAAEDLRRLHSMADEYMKLKDKKDSYDKALKAKDELGLKLDGYLKRLGLDDAGASVTALSAAGGGHGAKDGSYYSDIFGRMAVDLRSFNEAHERSVKAGRRVDDFKADHDVEELENLVLPEDYSSLADINDELSRVSDEAEAITASLRAESRQHDELEEKLEVWEEDQSSLGAKEEELIAGRHRYRNLQSASKYLTLAKESITSKYMEPLLMGFNKYYSAVTGTAADSYHIDANTNITVDELGHQRETELLSAGYRDLIGFCLRLSLIDAMYESEKPVLVLDDPFVNLDTERLAGAQRLLDTLSETYQLIYFTCR